MRALLSLVALLVVLVTPFSSTNAGIDPSIAPPNRSDIQLIVLEADGCIYCGLFRRDVLPDFQTSAKGKDMPVRFLDINNVEASGIALKGPITQVPTFIVAKANHEIGRIPGYVGPENFYHAIDYLLASAP